ncbi:hypothetical protein [Salegentibacter sediminis]|uniref:hypothetical protein n=1 Tax=Salegentibacter sediminis TaxID=1930251 RepID=UPI0009BF7172|nr:hypothetical protein [Salegentibacter sediminis]
MRNYLILFSLALVLVSCKNEKENQDTDDIRMTEQENEGYSNPNQDMPDSPRETSRNTNEEDWERENMESPDDLSDANSEEESTGSVSNSKYVKVDESDVNCECYCVDIISSGQSELCLKENEIYINARFSQSGNTTLVYFSAPSAKNTNDELPWEDFDTNTPIAEITPTADGMDLDWKGFSINGELAVDYAIYGKKTLEGSYKKQ